ncbi:DUF4097 family beta strand repeat-containing protein [Microbacterium marinilacus]|uniref:DUF4097 domain-containing protein n=1 Tax=Microbacterium marinilacus TaxID=415209 RepID=A0ABP7BG61_9MICO|nr:DUF4097 family beta strand repeat-containing protein [Microbacterium marinilacus]MBY0690164.1 DUF4097 domain-containing protein [Microbacterium marinilacus]
MTLEKWIVQPGQHRVIDLEDVHRLKVGLAGGQIDIIGHDEPGTRVEVHGVTVKDLRIEVSGDELEIDHPQLRWDNFLEVFRNFGSGGPRAEISVAVPRDVALTLGVVSAGALVAGLANDARVNTVSGDVLVDGLSGDLSANAVSGDVQARGLDGAFSANTVSGDVTVSGRVRRASVDSVSGATIVDGEGTIDSVSINTVSGAATLRLDDGLAANYLVRSASGKIVLDGVVRSSGGPSTVNTSHGELSGTFVDVRANTVSGDVTVLRRAAAETTGASAPAEAAAPAEPSAPAETSGPEEGSI